jgi:hypothetical protein
VGVDVGVSSGKTVAASDGHSISGQMHSSSLGSSLQEMTSWKGSQQQHGPSSSSSLCTDCVGIGITVVDVDVSSG